MRTLRLNISGRVQGVGFRPFIYRLARSMGITGQVSNQGGGVQIMFNADDATASTFLNRVIEEAPAVACINEYDLKAVKPLAFQEFTIVPSEPGSNDKLLVSPDFATCDDCYRELFNPESRFYRYPFTGCTHCGSRYSITYAYPYDRADTVLKNFPLCRQCEEEYRDPENRRYHTQNHSCASCGFSLSLDGSNTPQSAENATNQTAKWLAEGKIVAVKGVGGYLLVCDATNEQAVKELRLRKKRPRKPFALLYASLEQVKQDTQVTEQEEKALVQLSRPVVLLPVKDNPSSGLNPQSIAPNLHTLGVMLPSAPLLDLLSVQFGKPLVATSGNMSGSSIIYNDHEAFRHLPADHFLSHNREILVPQDDSVERYVNSERIMIRRSRGYAPSLTQPVPKGLADINYGVVAMGGELKSSIAILANNQVYTSQYLGNLQSFSSCESYRKVLQHLLQLLSVDPTVVLVDAHPDYFSSQYGSELAEQEQRWLQAVPHHEAHFLSVLAENQLLNQTGKVLGVVWDGTGLGADRHAWGGEFFIYDNRQITRSAHYSYYPYLLGNKMAAEPRIAALVLASQHKTLAPFFSEQEWRTYRVLLNKFTGNTANGYYTTSVGRLFDAVSAVLGLCLYNTYEGEAAMVLEQAARAYQGGQQPSAIKTLPVGNLLSPYEITRAVIRQKEYLSVQEIAWQFHCTLVAAIQQQVKENAVHQVAFSGGVFQNALLVELIQRYVPGKLYFHQDLPPNDECISYGQLVWYALQKKKAAAGRNNNEELKQKV